MKIKEKVPIETCIADMNVITKVMIESKHLTIPSQHKKMKLDVGDKYICKTCIGYLKKGKLPPSSAMNSLILYETDSELQEQDLRLTGKGWSWLKLGMRSLEMIRSMKEMTMLTINQLKNAPRGACLHSTS